MKDYLFILVNSSGRFYDFKLKRLNSEPKLNEVFDLAPNILGSWRVKSYEGLFDEKYEVYLLERI